MKAAATRCGTLWAASILLAVLRLESLTCDPAAAAGEPARITVHTDQTGPAVSPSLYGLFFEEINHAGEGGLYAEMLRNRSFEETLPVEGCTLEGDVCRAPALPDYNTGKLKNWSVPWKFDSDWPGWSLEHDGAEAAMSLESAEPVHPRNVRYLRLKIARLPSPGSVRLLNDGYWGVAVRAGAEYDFSCYARHAGATPVDLRVGVVAPDGKLLASATVPGVAGPWKEYACRLTAAATNARARFFLEPAAPGVLDLDVVSLFPRATFKNRPNGCRADVAQLLADLKPAFMRFPGGCVVEGGTMANRYRWKETIGDVVGRPGHWSLWGYRNTDGLGYHEFLQLCEDLGCAGMFVCNCGMACTGRNGDFWSDQQVDEAIQDTLDAVEYALGSPQTRWGAERVRNGHPGPLPLAYVEIGNENFGPRYEANYRRFAAALKKAWPQITLICDTGFAEADVHDQHFYVAPEFFLSNFHRYDRRPAPGEAPPRVYVGEYAVNRDVGSGNLQAALAEAVFMLGMERNSDYVRMASYAPLLFHVEDRRWPVNLVGFDSARSFGRASYYVQQMFATQRPDVNLACECTSPPLDWPGRAGSIGVGTWDTQAEFRDIRVTREGQTLFESRFDRDLKGWHTIDGRWQVSDGVLRQTSADRSARAVAGDRAWRDYTLSLQARKLSGHEGFLILFQQSRDKDKGWWNLGGWGNREHGLEVPGVSAPRVPGRIETGRWYDIRVELQGRRIRCWLDGQLIHDVAATPLESLYAGAGRDNTTGEVILKVVNASDVPQTAEVELAGLSGVRSPVKGLVLTGPELTAENSLDEPRKLAPAAQDLDIRTSRFPHAFPARSVSVLRIQPAGK